MEDPSPDKIVKARGPVTSGPVSEHESLPPSQMSANFHAIRRIPPSINSDNTDFFCPCSCSCSCLNNHQGAVFKAAGPGYGYGWPFGSESHGPQLHGPQLHGPQSHGPQSHLCFRPNGPSVLIAWPIGPHRTTHLFDRQQLPDITTGTGTAARFWRNEFETLLDNGIPDVNHRVYWFSVTCEIGARE